MDLAYFAPGNPAESPRYAGPGGSGAMGRGWEIRRFGISARRFVLAPAFSIGAASSATGPVAAYLLFLAVAFLQRFRCS